MGTFATLAEAFRYPAPGQLERLEYSLALMPAGRARKAMAAFLKAIRALSLGAWEELYTRTWDLNPLAPPYIGFQTWGEDYRRGNFMALLQRAYFETGIDPQGELTDHLVPVLRYLDAADQPIPELVQVLRPAVEKMAVTMRKRDPGNPYLLALGAVLESLETSRAAVLAAREDLNTKDTKVY